MIYKSDYDSQESWKNSTIIHKIPDSTGLSRNAETTRWLAACAQNTEMAVF